MGWQEGTMTEEFNLSDKIVEIIGSNGIRINQSLNAYDVKEFIKRQLCPICQKHPENNCLKCNKIKKDAGDKLI